MLMRRRQGGFTLIEIILAIAISSALITIALMGQAQMRQRASFTDSMERIKNSLKRVQGEALTTVNSGGGGTSSSTRLFGKRVVFIPGSTSAQVDTLLVDEASSAIVVDTPSTYSIPFTSGATYDTSTTRTVVFTRSPDYIYLVSGDPSQTLNAGQYFRSNTTFNPGLVELHFSSNGLGARVSVDTQNSTITRSFD